MSNRKITKDFISKINEEAFKNYNISKEELYDHFDENNDGQVNTDEYASHIKFHCENPETLEVYRSPKCKDTYNSTCTYYNNDPEYFNDLVKPVVLALDSECMQSSLLALVDCISKQLTR